MKLKRLNTLCKAWSSFRDDYYVCDDGHIYRKISPTVYKRLKAGYYRNKKYMYLQVRGLFGTDRQHTVRVARAVALAFVPNPDGLTDVDHINNDKTDNSAKNLQWLSHRDNIKKRWKDKEKSDEKDS